MWQSGAFMVNAHAVRRAGYWGGAGIGVLALIGPLACSSTDNGSIQIITGQETDTFTQSPVPKTLRIDAIDPSGKDTVLATASLPTDTIDLGNRSESTVAALNVSGLAADGKKVVFGASLTLDYAGLAGLTIPVFVQRTGQLARLPGPLSDSRQAPTLAVLQGEYLFIGGGNDPSNSKTMQLFDFASFAPLASLPTLPRAPKSIALDGTVAWLIDDGGGTYFDFSSNAYADIPVPPGGSFADIAGGGTAIDSAGAQYVVGGTRTSGAASAMVLKIDPGDASNSLYPFGNASWLTLTAPRLGASATWVDGRGLVVAGGSATAAGVEIIGLGSKTGSPLAYPPDSTLGGGAAPLDSQHVLLAGGVTQTLQDAGVAAIDLGCASQCKPTAWSALSAPIAWAQVFAFDPANGFVVGNEPFSGKTHAYRLTSTAATEVPTKAAHTYARAVWSPVGSIVLYGGSNVIESFTP
jgi:hypothetical protein